MITLDNRNISCPRPRSISNVRFEQVLHQLASGSFSVRVLQLFLNVTPQDGNTQQKPAVSMRNVRHSEEIPVNKQ